MKFCNKCNKNFSKNFAFCPLCGNELELQIECPKCKKSVSAEFKFCPYCGMEFVSLEKEEHGTVDVTLDTNNKVSNKVSERLNYNLDVGKKEYELGNKYYFGDCVDEDYEEAFKWYMKAAEKGNIDAQYQIGEMQTER